MAQPSSSLGCKSDRCSDTLNRVVRTGAPTLQGSLVAAVHCLEVSSCLATPVSRNRSNLGTFLPLPFPLLFAASDAAAAAASARSAASATAMASAASRAAAVARAMASLPAFDCSQFSQAPSCSHGRNQAQCLTSSRSGVPDTRLSCKVASDRRQTIQTVCHAASLVMMQPLFHQQVNPTAAGNSLMLAGHTTQQPQAAAS